MAFLSVRLDLAQCPSSLSGFSSGKVSRFCLILLLLVPDLQGALRWHGDDRCAGTPRGGSRTWSLPFQAPTRALECRAWLSPNHPSWALLLGSDQTLAAPLGSQFDIQIERVQRLPFALKGHSFGERR